MTQIESMTANELHNGGESLNIDYSLVDSPFGYLFIASTHKGICQLAFQGKERNEQQDLEDGLSILQSEFPKAHIKKTDQQTQRQHSQLCDILLPHNASPKPIQLHLKGTAFQLRVWNALLRIPFGKTSNYKQIAESIQQPTAARAVGTAIGKNPIALLIPCHRVIQTSGQLGGYRWGLTRKSAILQWEAAQSPQISPL